jgi:uncharacterized membrane protein YjjB (DUF3815 family)
MTVVELFEIVIKDAFWSAIASMGFGVLFNVPPRTLFGCALAGAAGHSLRTALVEGVHMPLEPATLLGAAVVGLLGMYFSQRWQTPAQVFNVTGAIPLVPGLLAYGAMLGFVDATVGNDPAGEAVLLQAMVDMIRTAFILGAIALGITTPSLLLRRQKPVV